MLFVLFFLSLSRYARETFLKIGIPFNALQRGKYLNDDSYAEQSDETRVFCSSRLLWGGISFFFLHSFRNALAGTFDVKYFKDRTKSRRVVQNRLQNVKRSDLEEILTFE